MDDEARRPRLDRAGGTGGTVIVPSDWRARWRRGKPESAGNGAGDPADNGDASGAVRGDSGADEARPARDAAEHGATDADERGATDEAERGQISADERDNSGAADHGRAGAAEHGDGPDAAKPADDAAGDDLADPDETGTAPRPSGLRARDPRAWAGWSTLETLRHDAAATLREAPTPRELWHRRPTRDELLTHAKNNRYLIAGLLVVVAFAASDTANPGAIVNRPLAAGEYQRVAFAHPPQVQTTTPSVRRLLDAIANGERLREQAVVAAAARATLERARAEAAAAAAGEPVPWLTTGVAPVPGSTPGSVIPGPGGIVLPARGLFTSGFGSRWGTMHQGIDIAGPIGSPIYAVANGTVIDAGPAQGFGLWVRIRHDDGTISVYGHMYDFFVSVGERVPAGMQIARIGNRGDSTGPHLHFEVIEGGQHVDPQRWFALRGLSLN
ncbi:M23 family metallopeptidase [Nocardia sp. NPDC057353]|uniref:M23 family metallopeptidase n=1 Tax=Nocardia sp. NPDC057353 TaxID=3346104 RepID=UPI00363FA37E